MSAGISDFLERSAESRYVVGEESIFGLIEPRFIQTCDIAMLSGRHLRSAQAGFLPVHIVARTVKEQIDRHLSVALGRAACFWARYCPTALQRFTRGELTNAVGRHWRGWRDAVRQGFLSIELVIDGLHPLEGDR
ncbi:hypothetical protein D3C81_1761350 [compost metagenome]